MIELILTNTLDSAPILDKLKERTAKSKKHILFVPDRFSLSYQKAVLEHLNIKGTFDIEVSSFPRLADKLITDKRRVLDKQSEIMLLRKVIDDNKDGLLRFGKMGKNADFVNDMYAAISQIRNSNISVDRLRNAIEFLPKRIADKTKDIVKIYHNYVEYIQNGYSDGTSKLQALCDMIYGGALNDCEVYISDFTSFSAIEYEIIKAIMLNAAHTHICLVDSDGENSHVFPKDVKNRLFSLADEVGISMDVSYSNETLKGDADLIYRGLYSYTKIDGEKDGRTHIVACASAADEIKTLARQINRLVRAEGARYKDIAVVCCDLQAYAPYIQSAFKNFSIPYYADIKQSLVDQSLTKLVVSAIKAVGDSYTRSSVCEFVKQTLLGFDFGEVCAFDNYCAKYAIDCTRFLSPFTIGEEKELSVAEKIRAKAVELLRALDTEGNLIKDRVNAVKRFLKNCDASALAQQLADWQNQNGFSEYAAITLQSDKKIDFILEQCDSMLGHNVSDWEDFCGILVTAFESVKISNVPLYSDSVFIGETSENRYANVDYMFIIGALAGKFPPEHVDNGIVSEREYVAWGAMGIDVQPDCRRRNSKERLSALMLLTRAKKRLTISYPATSSDGQELMPSSTVDYLRKILDVSIEKTGRPNHNWARQDYLDYISSGGNVLQEFLSLRALELDGRIQVNEIFKDVSDILYTLSCEKYGKDYVDFLIGEERGDIQLDGIGDVMFNGEHTSVSQFEKYFKCPFLHFNENVLKLKRKEVAGLEVKDTGILLHAVMEKYFSLENCAELNDTEIEKIVADIFLDVLKNNSEYAFLTEDKRQASTLKQLSAQAVYVIKKLVANMQVTKFRPWKLEAVFGARSDADMAGMQISCGGRKLSFDGVIDRIDKYKDNAIIIDYKSKHSIDFTPSDIFYGDRIQLFIYLNALLSSGNITPQGVFYLLMNNRFVKSGDAVEKRYMFNGFVNSQDASDLDKGFAGDGEYESGVYPIKKVVQNGGDSYVAQKQGFVMNKEQFDTTLNYVMRLTSKAAKEIEEGYIAKSPLNIQADSRRQACNYCDYKSVCARSKVYTRNVKALGLDDFIETIKDGSEVDK